MITFTIELLLPPLKSRRTRAPHSFLELRSMCDCMRHTVPFSTWNLITNIPISREATHTTQDSRHTRMVTRFHMTFVSKGESIPSTLYLFPPFLPSNSYVFVRYMFPLLVYTRASRAARPVVTSYVIVCNCLESSTTEFGEVKSSLIM